MRWRYRWKTEAFSFVYAADRRILNGQVDLLSRFLRLIHEQLQ
jgi:hypothetical protein